VSLKQKGRRVQKQSKQARFEQALLPHLGSAYNLARWLTRNDQDAEDVVQEAYLRAFKYFDGFRGADCRPWLLAIVRNTYLTWRQQKYALDVATGFDEEIETTGSEEFNPEVLVLQNIRIGVLREALNGLPTEFREVVILRDLEGLSYKEMAAIVDVPIGTIMSRLARARKRLQEYLAHQMRKES
jgi:RNA polymerase sigma factor (sigma-70 family)